MSRAGAKYLVARTVSAIVAWPGPPSGRIPLQVCSWTVGRMVMSPISTPSVDSCRSPSRRAAAPKPVSTMRKTRIAHFATSAHKRAIPLSDRSFGRISLTKTSRHFGIRKVVKRQGVSKNGRTGQHQWMATVGWSGYHVDGLTRST